METLIHSIKLTTSSYANEMLCNNAQLVLNVFNGNKFLTKFNKDTVKIVELNESS